MEPSRAMQLKPRKCKHCSEKYTPTKPMQSACSVACAIELGKKARAKSEAVKARQAKTEKKAERARDRAKKEAMKTIPQLVKEAQIAFNSFIRARDADKPCICCGLPLGTGEVGGAFDCGHYRSTGSASHLRFDERNAHAQRKICNRWGAGRAVDYRLGLISRIGLEAVESLESDNKPRKWAREELMEIKIAYKEKEKKLLLSRN